MKQKALYVDFDGTLTKDQYWNSLPPDEHKKIQDLLFDTDRQMVGEWMRGKHTAEEINEYVAEELGLPYDYLWKVFVSDCERMRVSPETLEFIAQLGETHITVLITGNMDSFTRFTQPALKLDRYFDHISNSYYEKKHKTDDGGGLFIEWTTRINIPLSKSLLIDDQKNCCSTFSALGGTAIRTESPDHTKKILAHMM